MSPRLVRTVAVLVLLAIPGLPNLAFACSCVWAGPFSKVALGKELIVLGEVLSHYKNSMEFQILDVVQGTEERRTIRIWGDNGALCRPYVAHFPIGTRWLLAVFPLPEKTGETRPPWQGFASPPGRREYAISVCGDFWLEVRGETAIGRITVNDYSNFLEWVSAERYARLASIQRHVFDVVPHPPLDIQSLTVAGQFPSALTSRACRNTLVSLS
ncbi:MAG TPA: hypothetical protein VFF86_01080 [Candidatus Methylomirabilis sp.]|nr:hypothetical protein [Candidatus Methylomirabilis sp.]